MTHDMPHQTWIRLTTGCCWLSTCIGLASAQAIGDPTRPAQPRLLQTPSPSPAGASSGLSVTGNQQAIAWLDGQPIRVGDWLNDAQVIAIEAHAVVVRDSNGQRRLSLNPGVVKKSVQK